jgi:hypothetical protein
MGVKRRQRPHVAYGIDNALQNLAPQPIVSTRNPGNNDTAEVGTLWINKDTDAYYILTSIVAGVPNWEAQSTGAGSFAAVTVTGGAGDVLVVDAGGDTVLGGTLDVAGNTSIVGNLDVTGDVTITGDFDITDTAAISITSTSDTDPAIYLHANGGSAEVIRIRSDQGSSANSVDILSDVGGVTITSGLASADAINIVATAGGIDADAAGAINIASSQNAAGAITIDASAGGIQITAAGEAAQDITIANTGGSVNVFATENSTGAILVQTNGGSSERIRLNAAQGTAVDSILLDSTAGGITLTSNLATADGINLNAIAGGVDIDGALQVNIASSQNAVNAIVINASAGGIDITSTSGGAGEDIDIVCTGGSVNITGSEAAADAITIQSSDAAGGVQISAGTGDLVMTSTGGQVLVTSTVNSADAIYLRANAGTSEKIKIHADQGSSTDSVALVSDVGGITLQSAATKGVIISNGTQAPGIYVGAGSPDTVLTAPKGSLYLNTTGSIVTDRAFINTDGATGWTGISTAA